MDSSFVEQLSSMQESARVVEQELAQENNLIASLKNQIHLYQSTKIEDLKNQIRKFEFETLKNETETTANMTRLKELAKEVDTLLEYRDGKLKSMKDDDNNEGQTQQQNPNNNNNAGECQACRELTDSFNFLKKEQQEDEASKKKKVLLQTHQLQQKWMMKLGR